jgi:hypothetical protein
MSISDIEDTPQVGNVGLWLQNNETLFWCLNTTSKLLETQAQISGFWVTGDRIVCLNSRPHRSPLPFRIQDLLTSSV